MAVGILPTVFKAGGGGGGVTGSLNDLSDVIISSPLSGQLLSFGSDGYWHNTNLSSNQEFQNLQSQVSSISTSGFTPLTTTAALTGQLTLLTTTAGLTANLQNQINNITIPSLSAYTLLSTTAALTGNLESQIIGVSQSLSGYTTLSTTRSLTGQLTPITVTAGLTASLQSQISSEIINRQLGDQNLQQQINEVAAGSHVVFSEQLTGNGITTHFNLTGATTNGQFISGGWSAINILNTLESDVTDLNGKPIYDGGILSIFTRHRIYIDNIDISGGVNLDYAPLSGQIFKIWYWYDLQPTDRINNYYRDDYVAKMEQTDGDLATNIQANVVNFNNILSVSDNTVQKALETLDDHTHPEIASISASLTNLYNTKQDNITILGGSNVVVTQSPSSTWTISVTGSGVATSANFIAGNGITIQPTSNSYIISVSDYISRTEVAAISAGLSSQIGNFVHLTGNESISGSKNFVTTPTVSGTYTVLHTGNAFYEHYQGTPSTLWNINHNLNRHPSVTTTNLSGDEVIGTVSYINTNTVTVKFTPARQGWAYLN